MNILASIRRHPDRANRVPTLAAAPSRRIDRLLALGRRMATILRLHHRLGATFVVVSIASGCASVPGAHAPKVESRAVAANSDGQLARGLSSAIAEHPDRSGFHLLSIGTDGLLTRIQMADAAERSLDLQYFILRSDRSGTLITESLLRAADRGVRVRILVDDGETVPGDEQIQLLAAHPQIQVRVFNPFRYRGHVKAIRATEFFFSAGRLDYRMHNKLFVVDNAVALIGGRNIGDEYFQVDPKAQFADDDMFASGPVVQELSGKFDDFWNSASSIPVAELDSSRESASALAAYRALVLSRHDTRMPDGVDYAPRIASGEPLRSLISGRAPLHWARWTVVCDSPDKRAVKAGWHVGSLMERPVAEATAAVGTELLMITPYLVPGEEGMRLFADLRQRGARVRILTNSLESQTVPPAQAGYMHYRMRLLDNGIDLFEVRSVLGSTRGSGQTAALSRFGNFSLHGKMFVFDRRRLFVGSMNFDQRSMHLNTEIGLIIDSPELAGQLVDRFEAMTSPDNAYHVTLETDATRGAPRMVWTTNERGMPTRYETEPSKTALQKFQAEMLTLLPIDREL